MFLIPFIVLGIVQIIKLAIDYSSGQKIGIEHLFSSGWFPSVHSAMSTSVVTLSLLTHGRDSTIFAVAFTFAFLLWYDAVNVRMEAGKHAMQINVLNNALEKKWPTDKIKNRKLKERIGHSPSEVLGWIIIGIVLTLLLFWLYQTVMPIFL